MNLLLQTGFPSSSNFFKSIVEKEHTFLLLYNYVLSGVQLEIGLTFIKSESGFYFFIPSLLVKRSTSKKKKKF